MKSIVTTLLLCCAVLFTFEACQNNAENNANADQLSENSIHAKLNSPTVAPPLDNVNVPFKKMTVIAEAGGTLSLDNGTTIEVPKDAFVDANGQPIAGEVEINYREFHNAAEIIASGIPMTNKTGDKYMQTAGMFEIQGTHNDQPIQIADDKTLKVNMASFVDDEQQYDFFYLDEEKGDWQNQGTAQPTANAEKAKKVKALPKVPAKPLKPEAPKTGKFKFNFQINYKKFPELKAYEGVIWEYAGKSTKTDPELNKWIFQEDWADISLEKASNDNYNIVLKSGDKNFISEVKPVLEGKNLQKARYEFEQRMTEYKKIKTMRLQEEERLAQEADLRRSFEVQQFGIFNWDIWKDPARQILSATFDFGDAVSEANRVSVFLVTQAQRSVIRFAPNDFDKFSFDPSQYNELIAVLPGNKIGKFTNADFKALDLAALKAQGDKAKLTFKMRVEDNAVNSLDELQAIVGM